MSDPPMMPGMRRAITWTPRMLYRPAMVVAMRMLMIAIAPLGICRSEVSSLLKPKFLMIVAWKDDTAPFGTSDEMHIRLKRYVCGSWKHSRA